MLAHNALISRQCGFCGEHTGWTWLREHDDHIIPSTSVQLSVQCRLCRHRRKWARKQLKISRLIPASAAPVDLSSSDSIGELSLPAVFDCFAASTKLGGTSWWKSAQNITLVQGDLMLLIIPPAKALQLKRTKHPMLICSGSRLHELHKLHSSMHGISTKLRCFLTQRILLFG